MSTTEAEGVTDQAVKEDGAAAEAGSGAETPSRLVTQEFVSQMLSEIEQESTASLLSVCRDRSGDEQAPGDTESSGCDAPGSGTARGRWSAFLRTGEGISCLVVLAVGAVVAVLLATVVALGWGAGLPPVALVLLVCLAQAGCSSVAVALWPRFVGRAAAASSPLSGGAASDADGSAVERSPVEQVKWQVEKISAFFESLLEKHVFRLNQELRERESEVARLRQGLTDAKEESKKSFEAEKVRREAADREAARCRQAAAELATRLDHERERREIDLREAGRDPGAGAAEGTPAGAPAADRATALEEASRRFLELVRATAAVVRSVGSTADGGDVDAGAAVETLETQLEGLEHLVKQLAALLRLEAGAETPPNTDAQADLGDILRDVTDEFREAARVRGVRIALRVADDARRVSVDADLLAPALREVIGNAVAYTDPGGRVSVSATLDAAAGGDGATLRVRVRDSGGGVPKKDRDRIFEPLEVGANQRPSISGPGAGLGLAVARACAGRLGGSLELEKRVRKGSAFSLTMPAAPVAVETVGRNRRRR